MTEQDKPIMDPLATPGIGAIEGAPVRPEFPGLDATGHAVLANEPEQAEEIALIQERIKTMPLNPRDDPSITHAATCAWVVDSKACSCQPTPYISPGTQLLMNSIRRTERARIRQIIEDYKCKSMSAQKGFAIHSRGWETLSEQIDVCYDLLAALDEGANDDLPDWYEETIHE